MNNDSKTNQAPAADDGVAAATSSPPANPIPPLQPGDILLYGGGVIGALIQFRTWSDVSHVEVYAGIEPVSLASQSVASRSDGVDEYPFRADGLRRILRPVAPFNFVAGLKWFDAQAHRTPYGYADLARFYLINISTKGLICSEFADLFFQACGLPLFNTDYPEGAVCPRDYETLSPLLVKQIWSWK